jgi:hypothetical protein
MCVLAYHCQLFVSASFLRIVAKSCCFSRWESPTPLRFGCAVMCYASVEDFSRLQDLLLVTSGELLLDLERARLQVSDNAECAKQVLVGTVDRFVKHRGGLLNEAALNALACAKGRVAQASTPNAYLSTVADFTLQRRLSGMAGSSAALGTESRLINYCDVLQRAYDRRSAVQDGMQGFPAMALAIEPPNVQLVDLVCMLAPDERLVAAECLFLQASVDRFLRGVAPLDVSALRHGCGLDPVASAVLEANPPAGFLGASSFVTRSSGSNVFGKIPSLLSEQLLRFIKDQLTFVGQARVGSGAAQRPLFSSLRDCIPMSLSAGPCFVFARA